MNELEKLEIEKANLVVNHLSFTNLEYFKDFIMSGVDVNLRNYQGVTALHNLVMLNKLEHIKILIKLGAKVNLKNNNGFTPLRFISSNTKLEIIKSLITNIVKLDINIVEDLLNNRNIKEGIENIFYQEFENDYKIYKKFSHIGFQEKILSNQDKIAALLEQANNAFEKKTGINMLPFQKLSNNLFQIQLQINDKRLSLIVNKVENELKKKKRLNIDKINSMDLNELSTSFIKPKATQIQK